MKRRKWPVLAVLGSCLVLLSVSLVIGFQLRLHIGAEHSRKITEKLDAVLPERTMGVLGDYPVSHMPVLAMEGVDYVAMLDIPAFDITLPVADQWDGGKLHRGPARFWGSAYDGTLVIGGMDDSRQFGFCDKIQQGTQLVVTDMTGVQFTYTVSGVDRAKHAETQWLTDADCDLTLFCHDMLAMEYIAVRCELAYR